MSSRPPGSLVDVGGVRLHLDARGPEDAPALLYVHGGPGQGAYDFMSCQGDRLSAELRVLGVDQRGVLFSDPLGPSASLTEHDLVADFEGLRRTLGISRWAVLGHSYGGRLALRYATSHPDSLSAVIFENPIWDHSLSWRKLYTRILPMLDDPARVRAILNGTISVSPAGVRERREVLDTLGDRRMAVYLHPGMHDVSFPSQSLPDEILRRASRFHDLLVETPGFYDSLLPYLDRLHRPALLVTGAYDPVTSDGEISRFHAAVPRGEHVRLARSGHFPHLEEPDRYASLIGSFLGRVR